MAKQNTEAKRKALLKAEEKRAKEEAKLAKKQQADRLKAKAKAEADAKKRAEKLASGKGAILLTVNVNGQELIAKTDDVAEALLALNPGVIKTKVVITAQGNDKKFEAILFNVKARRIFKDSLSAQFFAKRVNMGLGL